MGFIAISVQIQLANNGWISSIIQALPNLSAFSNDGICLSSCATQKICVSWLVEWGKMICLCSSCQHVYAGLAFSNFAGSFSVVH